MDKKDFDDVKLARPVALVDLWDIDDRINRLQDMTERLEKVTEILLQLYREERVKNWELILRELMGKRDRKNEGRST